MLRGLGYLALTRHVYWGFGEILPHASVSFGVAHECVHALGTLIWRDALGTLQ